LIFALLGMLAGSIVFVMSNLNSAGKSFLSNKNIILLPFTKTEALLNEF